MIDSENTIKDEGPQADAPHAAADVSELFPSLKEVLIEGWRLYWARPLLFSLAVVPYVVSQILYHAYQYIQSEYGLYTITPVQQAVFEMTSLLVSSWLIAGFLILLFNHAFGKTASVSQIVYSPQHVIVAAIALLYTLVVTGGLIFLIVPGLILAYRYMFAELSYLEHGTTVMGAFRKSAELTDRFGWRLFGMMAVLVVVPIASILLLGFGMLIALPVVMFAFISLYRRVQHFRAQEHLEPSSISIITRDSNLVVVLSVMVGLLVVLGGPFLPEPPAEVPTSEYDDYEQGTPVRFDIV